MKLLSGLVVLVVGGCSVEVAALVNCEVKEGPSVECAVKQTAGRAEMEVCFDFSVTCRNGATLEVNQLCQKLKDGGARNIIVPTDKIKISGPCEGEANGQVTNMTINGKVPKRK